GRAPPPPPALAATATIPPARSNWRRVTPGGVNSTGTVGPVSSAANQPGDGFGTPATTSTRGNPPAVGQPLPLGPHHVVIRGRRSRGTASKLNRPVVICISWA